MDIAIAGMRSEYSHWHIGSLSRKFDVADVVDRIHANPQLWNLHTLRTVEYAGPHSQVSDIWVRYNAMENYDGDRVRFNDAHESSWYEAADILRVKPLVMDLFSFVGGTRLGGVLITKIPAGGKCLPHVDRGWHATYYEKYAISLAANDGQAFCFDGQRHICRTGESFWFENQYTHWVDNDSDEDRMTLICCIRRT
jgi:hypothetical protein